MVLDEGAPGPARNALVNLLHPAAVAAGQPVSAAARTPAGPWYFACDPDGVTSQLDADQFSGVDLPELDPETAAAGAAAVFAAAAASPPEAMLALASDPDPAVRAQALAELATWPDDPIPVADAVLPAERLERLASCHLVWVRVGVAANPGTGPDTLAHLTADPDPHVLAALARIIDLPAALLIQLARTPDPNVQAELRRNPSAKFLYSPVTPTGPLPTAPTDLTTTTPADHPQSPAPTGGAPDLVTVGGPTTPAPAREATPIPTAAAADPTHPRFPRRAVGVLVAAAAVVLLTFGGWVVVSTLGPDPAPAASVTSTVPWNGMSLPTGPDGPDDPGGPVAAGFAHTELGAAMAAAHLSVRIDPYAGPASFEPTITTQTFGGDPAALLEATQDRYDTAAARAGITDGGPIPTSTGQILGWSTDGWAPDYPTTVHLLVTSPDGTDTDYGIGVVWVDGDYQLLDPTRDDTFTTSPAADADTYRRF
jgi:hypothetical protein